jgi:hypothetical protein
MTMTNMMERGKPGFHVDPELENDHDVVIEPQDICSDQLLLPSPHHPRGPQELVGQGPRRDGRASSLKSAQGTVVEKPDEKKVDQKPDVDH